MAETSVLPVGIGPPLLDVSQPEYAAVPGLTADTVREAQGAWACSCIMFGAGVRMIPASTWLFEALVNAGHEHAPALCFNSKQGSTAQAVLPWAPPA